MTKNDAGEDDRPSLDVSAWLILSDSYRPVFGQSQRFESAYQEGIRFERGRIRTSIEKRLEDESSRVGPVLRADLLRIVEDA